jgi:hypothetical protein
LAITNYSLWIKVEYYMKYNLIASSIKFMDNFNHFKVLLKRRVCLIYNGGSQMKKAATYKDSIQVAVVFQIAVGVLGSLMLDGGATFQIWCFTMLASWGGVLLVKARRSANPTRTDPFLIKWGFVPLFIPTMLLSGMIWRCTGVL